MIKFYKLRDYKFLKILKKQFKNPPKIYENGHVVLKIDNDLYHNVIDDNYDNYLEILKDIHSMIGIDFYFQKYPNFRYNSKNDNYPVWHSDVHFNHHPDEINVMIPITKEDFGFEIIDKGSFLLSKLPFKFLNTRLMKFFLNIISNKIHYLDSILMFNSHHLHTASNRNKYKKSRMSIDFRLLPLNHNPSYKKSLRDIPIQPGYYFSEKPISKY